MCGVFGDHVGGRVRIGRRDAGHHRCVDDPEPVTPTALLDAFSWQRVGSEDRLLRWTGRELLLVASPS